MCPDSERAPLDETEALLAQVLFELEEKGMSLDDILARHPRELQEALLRRLSHLGYLPVPLAGASQVTIPGYRIVRKLGQGGMAQVWLARRQADGSECALKTLRRDLATPAMLKRFRRESEVLSGLRHPGIVKVEEAGECDDCFFIAMERLNGKPLSDLLNQQDLQVSQVLEWLHGIAEALSFVHARGVMHRDIKPSNIFITDDGRAVLIDFGLTGGVEKTSLSMTGQFVGSPHYAAPEQVRGQRDDIGPLADIYALGVTLYECVAGRPPFEASTIQGLFRRILLDEPKPLERYNPKVPVELTAVVGRALEKNPDDRYPDAAALAEDLSAVLDGRPVAARSPGLARYWTRYLKRRPALAATLAVSLAAFAIFLIVSELRSRREEEDRRRRAVALMEKAQEMLEGFEKDVTELPRRTRKLEQLRASFFASPPKSRRRSELDQLEREVEIASARLELVSLEVLEILRSAEDLGLSRRQSDSLRARLYLQRWRMAEGRGDERLMNALKQRILALDGAGGEFARRVQPRAIISLSVVPHQARVDAFVLGRCSELSDSLDPRFVAAPLRGMEENHPSGSFALRVMAGVGELRAEDLIVGVEGRPVAPSVHVLRSSLASVPVGARLVMLDGKPPPDVYTAATLLQDKRRHRGTFANGGNTWSVQISEGDVTLGDVRTFLEACGGRVSVWRNGREFSLDMPAGVQLRPTRNPLWHGELSHVGSTPLDNVVLNGDPLLLLLRAPGFMPLRIPLRGMGYPVKLGPFRLWKEGSLPESFVPVVTVDYQPLIIMDREVTVDEYLDFLKDRHGEHQEWRHLVPNSKESWIDADGSPSRPPSWHGSWPIQHISWQQARLYAEWRTRKARIQGHPWRFELPTARQWRGVCGWYLPQWSFPWGPRFRPSFCKSCFSRDIPVLEPVLSFPMDENVRGLYDMAGGVSEWAQDWFWEQRQQKAVQGGSWVHGEPRAFECRWTWGMHRDESRGFVGLRLVLVVDED